MGYIRKSVFLHFFQANAKASKCKEDLALKLANEQNLHCKVNSLSAANEQLKTDLEVC